MDNSRAKKRGRTRSSTAAASTKTNESHKSLTAVEQILAAVKRIPRGRVSSYGEIAHVAGLPRRALLVGTVLKHTAREVPWFRVINSSGRISLPSGSDAYARQKKKLEAEGVIFRGDRVDMRRFGWPPREESLDEVLWKVK